MAFSNRTPKHGIEKARVLASKRFYPDSSMIQCVEYNAEMNVLVIRFSKGRVYMYTEVPERIFNGMKRTPSCGKYFHKFVKDTYNALRIEA